MASPKIGNQGYWVQGSNKGTWNLFWCREFTSSDEKTPHWCACTKDGKWMDSTLSKPIYHSHHGFPGHGCGCHGYNGCKCTPYCMEYVTYSITYFKIICVSSKCMA